MKGVYCAIALLRGRRRIEVGSLGKVDFKAGVYVYVGSAMAGVEQRVDRHSRKDKKKRWHIDYLMEEAEYLGAIAIPCESKEVECSVARALARSDGAEGSVAGFGCTDCRCSSHLFFFGDTDPEWVAESVSRSISVLECVYPRRSGSRAQFPSVRQ